MKLKRWIERLLIIFEFILIMFLASDCESTKLFISTHLIGLMLLVLNTMILAKYGRLMED